MVIIIDMVISFFAKYDNVHQSDVFSTNTEEELCTHSAWNGLLH